VTGFFTVIGDGLGGRALVEERMPGAVWYPEARLNYAENILRHALSRPDDPAVISVEEDLSTSTWTWTQLERRVAGLATRFAALGVQRGDRVAAVMPNVPETLVALLATVSVGAIWTVSSPDLSSAATLDRLRPLEPTILLGTSGYRFKGRWVDTLPTLSQVADGLPSTRHVVVLGGPAADVSSIPRAIGVDVAPAAPSEPAIDFDRVPFDHPLWVLFSSGTTGSPKGIVHGHGGMILEGLKGVGLGFGLTERDRYFTAANTSWMVWNTLGSTLLTGASVVTYAGAPAWPDKDRQFAVVAASGATMLSTGAAYLGLVQSSGMSPGQRLDLSKLRLIMSTGSVLSPSTWRWVHRAVKKDVHLSSDSGGTDICGGFIGGNEWSPVYLGELQGASLGVAVDVRRDDGSSADTGEVGEMVITRPMPSMPVKFWNDDDGQRYHDAYFAQDPSVWTHGDWISRTPRGGYVIHGRSDATLNRDGVRLGSADIYAALQLVPQVQDSVVFGVELPDGGYWMPLFVHLVDGVELDDSLRVEIASTIRARTSARHVPDAIESVPAIPITHAGKRIEIPLKKLFLGRQSPLP
jgi:acetoacetyl-CoA synthetase